MKTFRRIALPLVSVLLLPLMSCATKVTPPVQLSPLTALARTLTQMGYTPAMTSDKSGLTITVAGDNASYPTAFDISDDNTLIFSPPISAPIRPHS